MVTAAGLPSCRRVDDDRARGAGAGRTTWVQAGPVTLEVTVDGAPLPQVLDQICPPWPQRERQPAPVAWSVTVVVTPGPCPAPAPGPGDRLTPLATGHVLSCPARRTSVLLLDRTTPDLAAAVRRIIHQQVAQRLLGRSGWAMLHGGGVIVDHRALVFTGPSGAGKTTLQLDTARVAGTGLLGGGRTYLGGRGVALAYPGRFTVGTGYAANRSWLRRFVAPGDDQAKLALDSAVVAEATGTERRDRAPVGLVVAVRIGGERWWVRPLVDAERSAVVRAESIGPDTRFPNQLGLADDLTREEAWAANQRALAEVPVVEVGLPLLSESELPALERFLGQLLDHAA
jgi:hypothetical protein